MAAAGGVPLGEALRPLGLRRFTALGIGWMFVAVVAYLAVAVAYVAICRRTRTGGHRRIVRRLPVQILLIVVAAPISEEVCFRGMLFGGLRERLPRARRGADRRPRSSAPSTP